MENIIPKSIENEHEEFLSQLPPVEFFKPWVKYLACDYSGLWAAYSVEPKKNIKGKVWETGAPLSLIDAVRMPTINKLDWKRSLVHIGFLANWQKNQQKRKG